LIGRIFRVVRTPVTLLILFGVLLYGAWWGYNNIIKPVPALPPEPCVSQTVPKGQLKSSQVVVKVYNGGDRKGLAADVGRSLRTKGFRVSLTTNTVEKIQRVDRTVDVLVGNKYGGFDKKAKTTYQLDTDTVCLPSQTPSPTPALGN
jgi:hypothetical protein